MIGFSVVPTCCAIAQDGPFSREEISMLYWSRRGFLSTQSRRSM
jgi:hypothetical protein